MCDQFNFSVQDLRNQIETTDTYIVNYLPFRTIKELTTLLEGCFEPKVSQKIKVIEALKIKDMYARMMT